VETTCIVEKTGNSTRGHETAVSACTKTTIADAVNSKLAEISVAGRELSSGVGMLFVGGDLQLD
jgi:hypothetical protein